MTRGAKKRLGSALCHYEDFYRGYGFAQGKLG